MIWVRSGAVVSCRAYVVLPVLLLLMRWQRGRRAGFFDVATAGLAA